MVEALDWVITTLERDLPKLSGDAVVNCARNAMMELQRHQDKVAYRAMRNYLLAAMLQEPQHRQRLRTMNFERTLAFSMVCCTPTTSVLFAEQLLNAMVDWPEEAIKTPFSHLEQLTTVCALFEQLNRYNAVYPDLLRQCLQNTERWKDYAARVRADRRQASACFPWLADGDAQDDFNIPRAMREWLVNANAKTTARKDDF